MVLCNKEDQSFLFYFLFQFFSAGGVFATLMPKEEYFHEALYTFDIGQNDLGAGFFENMTVQQVNASVPDIVNSFSKNVKVVQYPILDI